MRFARLWPALLVLAACTSAQHSSAQASPGVGPGLATAGPGAAATPLPSGSPPAAASLAAGASVATAAPSAAAAGAARASSTGMPQPNASAPRRTPSPQPTVARLAPAAPPQIESIAVDTTTVHPGDVLHGTALTSSNVASVEVRIAGYSIAMQKVGVGRFTLDYTIGPVPFFFFGTYTAEVIARNTRGDEATRSLAITIE